jgi:hypothetical protein
LEKIIICQRNIWTSRRGNIWKSVEEICRAEKRPETMIQRILETAEMKMLREITNKILRDRPRSEDIGKTCKVDNINERVRGRRKTEHCGQALRAPLCIRKVPGSNPGAA